MYSYCGTSQDTSPVSFQTRQHCENWALIYTILYILRTRVGHTVLVQIARVVWNTWFLYGLQESCGAHGSCTDCRSHVGHMVLVQIAGVMWGTRFLYRLQESCGAHGSCTDCRSHVGHTVLVQIAGVMWGTRFLYRLRTHVGHTVLVQIAGIVWGTRFLYRLQESGGTHDSYTDRRSRVEHTVLIRIAGQESCGAHGSYTDCRSRVGHAVGEQVGHCLALASPTVNVWCMARNRVVLPSSSVIQEHWSEDTTVINTTFILYQPTFLVLMHSTIICHPIVSKANILRGY